MLFGYPSEAYSDNWLHEAIVQTLEVIHDRIDLDVDLSPWGEMLPASHRDALENRPALRERFIGYARAFRKLGARSRAQVRRCIEEQNKIEQLLQNASGCDLFLELPKQIQAPIMSLFDFAFDLLTPLKIRDDQYKIIYEGNVKHVCPFCGIEYFDAPDGPREDLDHYLVKSKYPFAAANLQNLVPMGEKCNKKYKKAQDILRDEHGIRRVAFYPYATSGVQVSLLNSQPFAGTDGRLPQWNIEFLPQSPECDTWDAVFKIRTRYRRDVLDEKFFDWLGAFSDWVRNSRHANGIGDVNQVADVLRDYLEVLTSLRLAGCDFLRVMVFEMLIRHCVAGNQRILLFLRDLLMPSPTSQAQA